MNDHELAEIFRSISDESRKRLPTSICETKVRYRLSWSSCDDEWTIHVMTESQQPWFKRTRSSLNDAVKAVQLEASKLEQRERAKHDEPGAS